MKKNRAIWYILFGLIFTVACSAMIVTKWYVETYTVRLKELLYTLAGPLEGTGNSMWQLIFSNLLPPILLVILLYMALTFLVSEHPAAVKLWQRPSGGKKSHGKTRMQLRRWGALGCVALLIYSGSYVNEEMAVTDYIESIGETTEIYEQEYVDPEAVAITAPEQPRNLICIVVESLETTYTSAEQGGYQEVNLMPELTQLADVNLSFAGPDTLSGWRHLSGTSWTMASLLAVTSGIPFAFPMDGNAMENESQFAPGLTTLGDILDRNGYQQEFLCGSDAKFAGRRLYFTSHGNYDIYDLFTARNTGRLPADYYAWWGFEDFVLFDIARDEATRLAERGEPFNLTMLTVDLHHVGGYVCAVCEDLYENDTADVVACTDRQVADFVRWCREQPFYENTTILIIGDHVRMDTVLVEGAPLDRRTVYNCYANAAVEPAAGSTENRVFTAMDIFPTTLAAMGFEIEGNRLGLGTNLFTGEQTLAERIGMKELESELDKQSSFYLNRFYLNRR